MAKSSGRPIRITPLQRLKVKPITDPAEQEALDARLKGYEKLLADAGTLEGGRTQSAATARATRLGTSARKRRR